MIEDTENVEEPLISPELAAELGLEEGADIVLSGKKKTKHKSNEPSEEVKLLAKQLSKKAQKRVAQITQRKEKESKREGFLSTIHDHEISEEHRQLLTSTRDINQSQTMKQLLSNIYRKQAAGLQLSPEESQLLYNTPIPAVDTNTNDDGRFPSASATNTINNASSMEVVESSLPVHDDAEHTLSFDDIIPQSEVTYVNKDKKAKKKSGNKAASKEKEEKTETTTTTTGPASINTTSTSTPTPTPALLPPPTTTTTTAATATNKPSPTTGNTTSLGAGLLAQLKLLKQTNTTAIKPTTAKNKSIANDVESSAPTADATNSSAYQVTETILPVDDQGGIVKKDSSGGVERVNENAATSSATKTSSALSKAEAAKTPLNKALSVLVQRSAEVQAARMELPVCGMEQEIVEAVMNSDNDAIILCGETGSGKSTQVPQFLYEAGFGIGGIIGITQPRRVAVTSTAERVSYEMTSGLPSTTTATAVVTKNASKKSKHSTPTNTTTPNTNGQLVGYQIRFDKSTVGSDTKIKFMTDGILLKEVAQDLLLRKYRVVILDEAHERNINTDVLLGMLSKVLPLRRQQSLLENQKYHLLPPDERKNYALPLQPLKLIIMSATMRVNDFQNPILFPTTLPPIIKVEARQYPVTTHFSKRTETVNYLKETHKKVCQIHRKLPEGGVLVFLSGKQEILYMCHKLAKSLNKKQKVVASVVHSVDELNAINSNNSNNNNSSNSGDNSDSLTSNNGIDDSIDIVGLGASREELMESQEGADITQLLNKLSHNHKTHKNNKNKLNNTTNTTTTTTTDNKLTMRDILNQDEIDSDSDIDMEDSDEEGSDSDDEGLAMDVTTTTTTTTTTNPSGENSNEEDIFILDGDDNAKKRTKHTTQQTTTTATPTTNSISSSGDSVRDQLMREALGLTTENNTTTTDTTTTTTTTPIPSTNTTTTPTTTTANANDNTTEQAEPPALRAYILPLYALMPAAQQNRVFLPVPPGHRLIVIATNVAETSITIPGIRYVVDSGRQKEKVMTSVAKTTEEAESAANTNNKRAFEGTAVTHNSDVTHTISNSAGIAKYEVKWVSQAAASQRTGRAGRTGPGHCYRLYSANFYHEYLQPYQPPEITVTPLEELILQMKALGIDHIERFPFPTPPPQSSIRNAINLLTNLGAIASPNSDNQSTTLTTATSTKNNKSAKNNHLADLSAAIAMATMQAMKSNNPFHHKQLLQLQQLHQQQQMIRDLCPLTNLGIVLARFPINPRFAKMLVMAFRSVSNTSNSNNNSSSISGKDKYVLLAHALTMVATLAERSAFDSISDSVANSSGSSSKKARITSGDNNNNTDNNNSDVDSCSEDESGVLEKNNQNRTSGGTLYYHEDGDAMARLRATGAYIHTVFSYIRNNSNTTTTTMAGNKNHKSNPTNPASSTSLSTILNKSDVTAANDSSSVKSLCSIHKLHAPTLQRIVELRDQLQDISASVLLTPTNTNTTTTPTTNTTTNTTSNHYATTAAIKAVLDVPLSPPSAAQELALRQLLVSGFCDSIAKRVPLGIIKSGPRRRRLCAYYSSHPSLQDIPLYIHPGSNLYNKDPTASLPEYITYQNLVRNQRGDCVYMTCVSVVNPLWLSSVAADCPLLKWSEPILTPTPYYDSNVDSVMCFVTPRFGVSAWDLPPMRRSLFDCTNNSNSDSNGNSNSVGTPLGFRKQDEAYRWFAKLLLEGNVFSTSGANSKTPANSASALNKIPQNTLKELRSALNKSKLKDGSASVLTQMKPIPKVSNLLRKLVTREVCNLLSLCQQLSADHSFLSEEILEFLTLETRKEFRSAWLKLATTAVV